MSPRPRASDAATSRHAVRVLSILLALSFLGISPLMFPGSADDQPRTRASPGYSGTVDGDGEGDDICLAGCRFYTFTYNFTNAPVSHLDYINISKVNVEPPIISTPVISYSIATGVTKVIGDLEVSVDEGEAVVNSTGLGSFTVQILFHLNWSDPQTRISLVPYLDYGAGPIQLQTTADEVTITVWGRLEKPRIARVVDGSGRELRNMDLVRSNSTVRIEGVTFSYWHSSENLSGLSPMAGEVVPSITDGYGFFEPEPGPVMDFILTTPATPQGEWELTMVLSGMQQPEWPIRVQMWSLTFKLDGYGPTFELTAPTGRVGEGAVGWTVTVSERPVNLANMVDGDTLMVRLRSGSGQWTNWTSAGENKTGSKITLHGSSFLTLDGFMIIQFQVRDVLGNQAESMPYEILLNHPPKLSIPLEYRNLTLRQDQSIDLIGLNFTVDEDDYDGLTYNWSFDGDPIGTGSRISKPLFLVNEGTHNITLAVSDSFTSRSISFTIEVERAKEPAQDPFLKRLLNDPVFQVVGSSVLAILVIILISVLIIVMVRRFGRSEEDESDFIISEDASRNNEDIARKLHEMYSGNFTMVSPDGSATAYEDMSGDEFDFDYNLYEILGLDDHASADEIRSAYRKLAAYYHPDRVAHNREADPVEAREVMVRINKAKEFLMNPERKARYDEHLSELDFSIET